MPSLSRQSPGNKQKTKRIVLALCVLIIALAAADYMIYPSLPIGGKSFNRGLNGAWLKDSWWRGTEKRKISELAKLLQTQQIRYAYFHARFIKKDGQLRFRGGDYARRAQVTNKELKRLIPSIKSLAWVYIGNERGLTGVDLESPAVRKVIVREALWLSTKCGFDGIHWDYEICENGEPGLLKLLEETRAALPKAKYISIATNMWLPPLARRWGWSEDYFARIASRCDQIAIMGYDSAVYFPRHYVWLMKEQVWRVSRAAQRGNPRCSVLLGVPTYEDGGRSHHVRAENLHMALKAARACGQEPPANLEGLAIFAEYSTDAGEWNNWRKFWLER